MPLYSGDGGGSAAPYGAITPPKPPPKPPPVGAPYGETVSTGTNTAANGDTNSATVGATGGNINSSGASVPPIDQILGGDAAYQQLLAFDKATSGEDSATMNANIARMTGYYGNDNDPLTILGRVYQAYQDRNRYIANTLTGHGMINSGETGFQGSRATLDYQRQELDARMKLQDYIDGLTQAFKQAERQRKFNEMQASWNAIQNYLNGHIPTGNPPDHNGPNAPGGIDTGGNDWDPGSWTPPTVDPGAVAGIAGWGNAGNKKKVIGGMGGFGT